MAGAIVGHLTPIFASHPTPPYVTIVRSVRMVGTDAAILRAIAGTVPTGKNDMEPAHNAIQTVVAGKQAGESQVLHFHKTPAQFHGRPELVEEMTAELLELLYCFARQKQKSRRLPCAEILKPCSISTRLLQKMKSALQFVRKLSGYQTPSKANEAAFNQAVQEVAVVAKNLLDSLISNAEPRNRETELERARARNAKRFGAGGQS